MSAEAGPSAYRALWVDAFHPGLKDQNEVRKLVTEARAAHFNAIFVHARRRGEVFYNSLYDPKAPELAPGFDPLAEVIKLAHDTSEGPRIEVHAWMVAYPIWNDARLSPKSPKHFLRTHSDWLSKDAQGKTWDGESFNFDPANPNVQRYIFTLAMELVSRYDIDGLSLDRIRYPGNTWGYTSIALNRYALLRSTKVRPLPTDPGWDDFRREQVTSLVRKIYLSAIEQKPRIKVSASTITWSPSITALSEWSTSVPYLKVLQDWRSWMKEGILDLNIPMDYYRQSTGRNDFVRWASFAADQNYGHQVLIGCAGYLNSYAEGREQIRMVESVVTANSAIQGFSLYSYATPANATNASFAAFATGAGEAKPQMLFTGPASIPAMSWKSNPWAGHLKGFVRAQKKGGPLEGVRILIIGGKARSIPTDATGFYGFVNVEPALYAVIASAPGYNSVTNRINVSKGRVATVDFLLTPAKKN